MRISIATRLLIFFFLVVGLSFLPAYLYLRRNLKDRILDAVEAELLSHARMVATRLTHVPDSQLDVFAREISGLLPDRITVLDPAGRVVGESAVEPQALGQIENHLSREEVQQALARGRGKALRTSSVKGEPYLYVALLFHGSDGKPRGVVRLSRPIGVITSTFQGAFTFLYRAAGAAATLVLLLVLGAAIYLVRPLHKFRDAVQAFSRGEYTHPLPERTRDELGDLSEALGQLVEQIQRDMVAHSVKSAMFQELVRALPVPILVVSPDLDPLGLNASFREAVEIDPAHEQVRVHQLLGLEELARAREAALQAFEPRTASLSLPWRKKPIGAITGPLPVLGGRVGWYVILTGPYEVRFSERRSKAARQLDSLIARARDVLDELMRGEGSVQRPAGLDTRTRARLCELRAALALLLLAEIVPAEDIKAIELEPLLERVLDAVAPVADAEGVSVEIEGRRPGILIADAGGRTERVLAMALIRAIRSARRESQAPHRPQATLTLAIQTDGAVVKLHLAGLARPVPAQDLDPFLSAIGGGVGAAADLSSSAQLQITEGAGRAEAGSDLCIQLRCA